MTKTTQLLLTLPFMMIAASAATISNTGDIGNTTTNWTSSISLPQFNPALGTLNSVQVSFLGDVIGSAGAENTSNSTVSVHTQLSATLTLSDIANANLLTVTPASANFIDPLLAYDGVLNFGGTSGITHSNIGGTDSNTITLTTAAAMAPFIGALNVNLGVSALASSSVTDGGNLAEFFTTNAGASATVTYNYTPSGQVPEPSSMGLLGLGFAAVGLIGRKRAKRS